MIKRIELGNTNKLLSQFPLGTMLMGSAMSKEDSYKILDDYVFTQKGNNIDTANNYAWWIGTGEFDGTESENLLGRWISDRGCREDIFLSSKIGARQKDHMAIRNEDGIPRWEEITANLEGASAEVVRNGLDDSLKRLQTDYLDMLYIHVDDRNTPLEETLGEINSQIKKGKIRHYGYSNIQTWRIEKVFNICEKNSWEKPVAIQMEYSYLNPAKYDPYGLGIHAKEDLFDWLDSNKGISLVAYSPLLKGIYANEERAKNLLSSKDYNTEFCRMKLEKISKISKETGINPNTLVLAWMAHKKENIFPLIGFSKRKQYEENKKAFDVILKEDIMKELES